MLRKPEYGWTYFQPNETISYPLSYLTDVAEDWMIHATHGLMTQSPFTVHGFCEPGRMLFTVSYDQCYVIFDDDHDDATCTVVEMTMLEFCRNLHKDISDYLEEWVHWFGDLAEEFYDADTDEEALELRRDDLQEKLDKLGEAIEENADSLGSYFF